MHLHGTVLEHWCLCDRLRVIMCGFERHLYVYEWCQSL